MFRFANSEYLYLLTIIPVLVVLHLLVTYLNHRNLRKFGGKEIMKKMLHEHSSVRPHVKFALLAVALALVVFCMARPQYGNKVEKVKQRGLEIMVALDVSNSMKAEDIAPNRLEKAKQMLSKLVEGLGGDKVGLVVFAGDAFIQLPITSDFISAKMFISSISTDMVPTQGTSVGAAVDLCMRSFSDKEGVGRAIILITDGENHEDDAIGAARRAQERGVNIYVVGMGEPNGAPIPTGGGDFKRDRAGNVVVTKLNEEMCRQIAQTGNGIYVRADKGNLAFRHIENELKKISTVETEGKVFSSYKEQFQTFAWLALLLLLLEFFILERKNRLFRNKHFFD